MNDGIVRTCPSCGKANRVRYERLAKDIASAKERAKPMWGEQRARLDQQIGKAEADYGRRCR